MLVVATSDKGGTGRSVTTCNVAFRRALQGEDVCYLDFDFGSPTAGAIFGVERLSHGTDEKDGLHRFLQGEAVSPGNVDVWLESRRPPGPGTRPAGAGRLVFYPGDLGGGEFTVKPDIVERCAALLVQLQSQFEVIFVDLSAGRSHAAEMILTATAKEKRIRDVRWLVFHRWTRQHIAAAADLVFEDRGLLQFGKLFGHEMDELRRCIRFVRTAVIDPKSDQGLTGMRAEQEAWLRQIDKNLNDQANYAGLGRTSVIETVPVDPVLQWREQLITDEDVFAKIANQRTAEAFARLADSLDSPAAWSRI